MTRWIRLLLLALVVGMASPAHAQTVESSPPAVRVELAAQAFKKLQFEQVWDLAIPRMIENLAPFLQPMLEKAKVPADKMPEVLDVFKRNMVRELTAPALKEEFIRLGAEEFAREFDETDLRALIAFYDSPVGRKLIQKQPMMAMRMGQLGERLGGEAGRRGGEAAHAEAVRLGLLKK